MTVQTAKEKQNVIDFYNEEVDPFKDLDGTPDTLIHAPPSCRWINVFGKGKRRKTLTLLELAKLVRVAYIDFEKGTSPYGAKVFHASNYIEAKKSMNFIESNRDKLNLDVIVLDPVDNLLKYLMTALYDEFKVDDLGNIKLRGKGNGWNLLYNRFSNFLSACYKSATLLITVTHLKLSTLAKDADHKIGLLDFDLIGQAKAMVENGADAHLFFEYGRLDENSPEQILVSPRIENDYMQYSFGSRGGILSDIHTDIHTPQDFIEFITKMVTHNKEDV